ncbi:hypothetical protein G4V62_10500 [Bacillaceae bacterium SIJ1]|uniref:PucR family transcriptional regulator n=1 Tax=Litoribacterium kuwaitense TaxID=1398745 RepID=UPI0013ECC9AB|nr:helix-turn-helix domain-containing protein [Litoribacterium kuwaitense]NGP45361.1 hypothetical protein [Litoribacterium kuwaitense]
MLDHLKRLYQDNLIFEHAVHDAGQYEWFHVEGQWVGILKTAMGLKERQLLELFFSHEIDTHTLNDQERPWHQLFIEKSMPTEPLPEHRLIHFHIKEALLDRDSFAEAVKGIYPYTPVIIWESLHRGFLIEPQTVSLEEPIAYEDLAEALTGDFYSDVHVYIGHTQKADENAYARYLIEQESFAISRKLHSKSPVFFHAEQLPLYLVSQSSQETIAEVKAMLEQVADDKELLHSVRKFLESNMNISTAAKALFVHRNSLQYRVDKFIERTQLDVKTFHQAVTVYIAMLAMDL